MENHREVRIFLSLQDGLDSCRLGWQLLFVCCEGRELRDSLTQSTKAASVGININSTVQI